MPKRFRSRETEKTSKSDLPTRGGSATRRGEQTIAIMEEDARLRKERGELSDPERMENIRRSLPVQDRYPKPSTQQASTLTSHEQPHAPEQEEAVSDHEAAEPPKKKKKLGPQSKEKRKQAGERVKERHKNEEFRERAFGPEATIKGSATKSKKYKEKIAKNPALQEAIARKKAQKEAWKAGTLGQSSDQTPGPSGQNPEPEV